MQTWQDAVAGSCRQATALGSAAASVASPGSGLGQRWPVHGGRGSLLRGTAAQSLLCRARRPGTRPAAQGGCAPAGPKGSVQRVMDIRQRGCISGVVACQQHCLSSKHTQHTAARLNPASPASSPPTSAGRRRKQYTSLKYISPPGASTRYTFRSTRALSGDRLICFAVQGRPGQGRWVDGWDAGAGLAGGWLHHYRKASRGSSSSARRNSAAGCSGKQAPQPGTGHPPRSLR
jgi:hypothetical protein